MIMMMITIIIMIVMWMTMVSTKLQKANQKISRKMAEFRRINKYQTRKSFLSMAQQPLLSQGFTITLGRAPPDEWLARRRDVYLTTRNTQNRQTSIPPAGFVLVIPASGRPHTHALDYAATGIGSYHSWCLIYITYFTTISVISFFFLLWRRKKHTDASVNAIGDSSWKVRCAYE